MNKDITESLQIVKNNLNVKSIIGALGFIFLLWVTLRPVELRLDGADELLIWAMPVFVLVALPMLFLRKGKIHVSVVDWLVLLWMIYFVCRTWMGGEYACATQFLKNTMMFVLYFVARIFFGCYKTPAKIMMFLIMLFGCYEALWGLVQIINGSSRHYLYLLTGNFQNPGPYSAYLTITAVIGAVWILRIRTWKYATWEKYVVAGMTVCCLIVLPATWSRAAFVTLGLIALWIYPDKYKKYKYLVWFLLLLLAVGFYFIKQGSADGRMLIWQATLTSWLHSPWLGGGTGSFNNMCSEGIAEMYLSKHNSNLFDSAGVADYAYNDFLRILAEQGVAGAVLTLTIVVLVMIRIYKCSRPLFYGLLSLIIFSMFSYPFELIPYRIIAISIAAWTLSVQKDRSSLGVNKFFIIFASCMICVACYFLYKEISPRKTADKDYSMFSGIKHAAFIDDYYDLLPQEYDNPTFLFDFAKSLRMQNRFNDSNAFLKLGTKVCCDPMFYVLIGNNYSDMGLYQLAEKSYKKAYAIMPNRMYPLYQIMNMYEQSGQHKRALLMAKRIINYTPKIKSPATEEMKQKARNLVMGKVMSDKNENDDLLKDN